MEHTVSEKTTFTFRFGPLVQNVKLVFSKPNPFKMAPSAIRVSTTTTTMKRVTFADRILLNYIEDHTSDDPEWFTRCGDQFQSMSLSKIHGLTESFTLEGRELWGKLNHSADSEKKIEWSQTLRPQIAQLNLLDHARVGDAKKRDDLKIAIEQASLHAQKVREAEQLAKINAANKIEERKKRRDELEKSINRKPKKGPKSDLRLK